MPRITTHFETHEDATMRHLVLGHSQLRHVWEHYLTEADMSICIDWISVSGGYTHELAQMIRDACAVIQDLDQFMMNHPDCKLALPEVKLKHAIVKYLLQSF